MPVRRRFSKRKGDPKALADAWCEALETGYDFFGELADQGVPCDAAGRPDLETARAAWTAYGPRVIATGDPELGPTWGEEHFGKRLT